MTTALAHDDTFTSAFRELTGERRQEPPALSSARAAAFAEFERLGFPTLNDEEWKYTNLAPIARTEVVPVVHANGSPLPANDRLKRLTYEEAPTRLVFINGIFRRELSATDLPEGVLMTDLSQALAEDRSSDLVRRHLERDSRNAANGFTALNGALFADGTFVKISRNAALSSPIHLLFLTQMTSPAPAAMPRLLVHAEANSSATIIESYGSLSEGPYLTNTVVDLAVDDRARLTHYRVQRESPEGFHIATTRATLGAQAAYDTLAINLGAALSRHNVEVTLAQEGASCAVDGLYMVEGDQHSDTHSLIDHQQPNCTSRQLYKGILDGRSRAVFNGKVFVRHGAQQTDAQQTNKNLLLSAEAQIDTKPQLEIYADDVKCTHGAAVGQLEEDEMFYLESRGLNPALAKNLLTYGFAEEVIAKIKIDSIKRELDEAVLNRLHADLQIEK